MTDSEREARVEEIRAMLGKPEEIGAGFAPGIVRILLEERDRMKAERDHHRRIAEERVDAVDERDAALAQVKRLREALETGFMRYIDGRVMCFRCGAHWHGEHDPKTCEVADALASTEPQAGHEVKT